MPDALQQFTDETIEELLKKLPVERKLKGVSTDDLLAALARRLKDYEALAKSETKPTDADERKPERR